MPRYAWDNWDIVWDSLGHSMGQSQNAWDMGKWTTLFISGKDSFRILKFIKESLKIHKFLKIFDSINYFLRISRGWGRFLKNLVNFMLMLLVNLFTSNFF